MRQWNRNLVRRIRVTKGSRVPCYRLICPTTATRLTRAVELIGPTLPSRTRSSTRRRPIINLVTSSPTRLRFTMVRYRRRRYTQIVLVISLSRTSSWLRLLGSRIRIRRILLPNGRTLVVARYSKNQRATVTEGPRRMTGNRRTTRTRVPITLNCRPRVRAFPRMVILRLIVVRYRPTSYSRSSPRSATRNVLLMW